MLFLYFLKCLAPGGHTSSNTGVLTGWEVLTGPAVYTPKNREFLFIFVLFDHSLPLVLPNYRKSSVWTRKLVPWIHISFVGQWSSCMWHDFCWHIAYSPFSFFFSPKSEKDYFHWSHKSWRVPGVSLWPSESFHHLQLQFSLLQLSNSNVQRVCGFVAAQLFSHLAGQICLYDIEKESLVPSSFSALDLLLMDGASNVHNQRLELLLSH